MKQLRWVGKDLPRPDTAAKATGKAHYIHDLTRPGMLYGKVKFSDHAHARIIGIDTSRAEKIPGVRAVLTGYNTPEVRIGFLKDNFALKRDKVRQFRDEVAAVAATDPDIAAEAIAAIKVEYEPLTGVFTPQEALAEGAPLIHARDARGNDRSSNRLDLKFPHHTGDLDEARRNSKFQVEGTFSTQRMQQSCMGCMGTAGCIAEFDLSGNLTMWAKTQIPFLAQKDFNEALAAIGLPGRNSRVIVPVLGGGFGSGLDTHAYEYICMLLAQRTGMPVKILYTREEEFANLSPRQSCTVRIAQGCDDAGRLTFRDVHVLQDNGAYTSWGATYPSVMMLPATSLYKVPVVHFSAEFVYTNNTYCQAMRGYGNPELNWALESNLDELAIEAGIDPLAIREINCNEPGETTPMGLKIATCGLRECIESSSRKLGWKEKRGRQRGKARGVGIAALLHVGGSGRIYRSDGSGIMLRLDDFGNVYVHAGGVEMGQGHHSALSLIVAESLGVTPDKVHMVQTDTATCPWDVGTHASRGAFTGGNAAIMAVEKLRKEIFQLAEEILPAEIARNLKKYQKKNPGYEPPAFDWNAAARQDRLELADGVLTIQDAPDEPWLKLDFGRFLRAIHFREEGRILMASAFYEPPTDLPDWSKGYGNLSANYAFGAQGIEVEVDRETGDIRILRVVSAHDVGQVLNLQTLKGQIYGGLAQGIGYALYEEIQSVKGRIRNPNFTDYKIPTAAEMNFPIDLEFIETDDPSGPYGAKGVGEPGMCPTAPAIANAVYDAVGVRIRDLPITPEKVLAALDEKRNQSPVGGVSVNR